MIEETRKWPPEDERDLAMGRFMDAWSRAESAMRLLFEILSGTSGGVSHAIGAAIADNGRMIDLLVALGALRLSAEDQTELKDIRKYFLVLARYRNSIVHGVWGLRPNSDRREIHGVVHHLEWIRFYPVMDREELTRAVVKTDKKGHEKYIFNVPRLRERAEKALAFADRLDALSYKAHAGSDFNQAS